MSRKQDSAANLLSQQAETETPMRVTIHGPEVVMSLPTPH